LKHFAHILAAVALHAWSPLLAQQWELGGNVAATGFMGDINPANPFYFKSMAGGIQVTYNLNPTWGIGAGYQYLHLNGADRDSKDPYLRARGQVFNNQLNELSLRANFNFFRFIAGRAVNRYTPYLFMGVAVFSHRPYIYTQDGSRHHMEDLQLQQESKVRGLALALPLGIGFKYNVNGPWSLGAELAYRVAFEDNLDNISNNYPTTDQYPADYAAAFPEMDRLWWESVVYPAGNDITRYAGKSKGNSRPNDGYMTAGVTLTYTFISKRCYWWN